MNYTYYDTPAKSGGGFKAFLENLNTLPLMYVIGLFLAAAATVCICIFILPEAKREKLPKLLQLLQDIFSFKTLLLEKVLRFLYTFATMACVFVGICLLFAFQLHGGELVHWYGLQGIGLILGGTIGTRIVFEIIMMFILLVKNTIEINQKLKDKE